VPRRLRRVIISGSLAVFLALLLLGIGVASYDPEPPGDPSAVALRIEFTGGGPLPPAYSSATSSITVYGDGRILERRMRYDGTVRDNVVMDARLTRDAYREMYRDALLAGLGTSRRYEADTQIADGGLLKIGLLSERRWRVTEVPQGAGGAREWMVRRLVDRMDSVMRGADDLVRRPSRYRPQRLAVVAWRPEQTSYGKDIVAERPWPLRPLAQGGPYPGEASVTCTVLTGRDIEAAAALAARQRRPPAHSAVTGAVGWRSGGHVYLVHFRPLLPEEKDCSDLPARW
jgi:hypothetical protein